MKRVIGIFVVIAALLTARVGFAKDEVNITNDITEVTNLTIEVVREILPEGLKEYAQNFIDGEKEYGVNMLFVLAIAKQETSFGQAGVGSSKNNLFGVRSENEYKSFDNFGESIDNEFRLLREVYLDNNRTTIGSVARVYCQPPEHWESAVSSIFNEYVSLAEEAYTEGKGQVGKGEI